MAIDMKPFDAIPPEQLVFALPGTTLKTALEKFQGKRTLRTVAAAQRIAEQKKNVRVPRNILRKFWRATGGWDTGRCKLTAGWGEYQPTTGQKVMIGDLTVYFHDWKDGKKPKVLLAEYRGQKVFHFVAGYYGDGWKDLVKVHAFAIGFGEKVQ